MSDYKPLTDEELVNQEYAMFAPRGMSHNHMYSLLLQQARRANAIIDALKRHHPYCEDLHDDVVQAIAAYLGESHD